MTKQPSPKFDALRAMREAAFDRHAADDMPDATRKALKGKLETRVREAAASSDAAVARRKAKKAAKNLRRANPG